MSEYDETDPGAQPGDRNLGGDDQPELKSARNYAVGYGRPPAATRFKPGRSGNPRGRPKGTLNLTTAIDKELNALIPITENGQRKKITKKEAVAKQMVNKAASGDPKAMAILLNQERISEQMSLAGKRGQAGAGPQNGASQSLDANEQAVVEGILERLRRIDAARHPQVDGAPPTDGDVGGAAPNEGITSGGANQGGES